MIEVNIKNTTKKKINFRSDILKVADIIIKREKIVGHSELSLIIVADQKIKSLAIKYKNKNYITDVLSFSNDWKLLKSIVGSNIFGDIYINKNKVLTQSKKYNHSYRREFLYLFAHGLLHLLGHDHLDINSEKIMHNKAETALKKLGVFRNV